MSSRYIVSVYLVAICAWHSCSSQELHHGMDGLKLPRSRISEVFPHVHPYEDNEYFYVDNMIGAQTVFARYRNFEDDSTRIVVQNIFVLRKDSTRSILFGNLMGGQVGMVLVVDGTQIIFADRFRSMDSVGISDFGWMRTYEIRHQPIESIMHCLKQQTYSIYVDSGGTFARAYDDFVFEETLDLKRFGCTGGVSYDQSFMIVREENSILLNSTKRFHTSDSIEHRTYILEGVKFVLQ